MPSAERRRHSRSVGRADSSPFSGRFESSSRLTCRANGRLRVYNWLFLPYGVASFEMVNWLTSRSVEHGLDTVSSLYNRPGSIELYVEYLCITMVVSTA